MQKYLFALSVISLVVFSMPPSVFAQATVCNADISGDGKVNITDYSALVRDFLRSPLTNLRSDITGDGVVNLTDYTTLVRFFLQNCDSGTLTKTYAVIANDRDAWSGDAHSGNSTHEVRISGYNLTNEKYEFVSNDADQESAAIEFALDIPRGAVITDAYMTVKAVDFENPSPTGAMTIHLYNVASSTPFQNGFFGDLLTHHPTSAQTIPWAAGSTGWTAGTLKNTPSLASLVQTFVNRSDYAAGNFIGFAITEGTIESGRYYGWEDFAAGTPAKLTVTYTTGTTPTATPVPTPIPSSTPLGTPTSGSGGFVSFPIGQGFVDIVPRQIVRGKDDHVYVFAGVVNTTSIKAYWTSAAGLPTQQSNFTGSTFSLGEAAMSVDAVYDGNNTIFVLANTTSGNLKVIPFDITTKTFKNAKTIATGNPTHSQTDIGTSGVSGMVDLSGRLHISYWSAGNHVSYRVYSYTSATDVLTSLESPTQLDGAESSNNNHPSLAISPVDGEIIVAWVSGSNGAGNIWARRKIGGVWGSAAKVNTSPAWTSSNAGLNIDQGPGLQIAPDGTRYLVYMQDWENIGSSYEYGRIHVVTNTGGGWSDSALPFFTHDPAPALISTGRLFVLGHGFSTNPGCTSLDDMCVFSKENGSWISKLFKAHSGTAAFDASPSVKWSVVGWNRPENVEFLFFSTPYDNSTIYYGRF